MLLYKFYIFDLKRNLTLEKIVGLSSSFDIADRLVKIEEINRLEVIVGPQRETNLLSIINDKNKIIYDNETKNDKLECEKRALDVQI